jgi:hypothetical protein
VQRRIFGPKRDEVTGAFRYKREREEVTATQIKLHYEEVNNFYSSRNVIRVIK